MASRRPSFDEICARVEEQAVRYHQAAEQGERELMLLIQQRILDLCGPDQVLGVLVNLLARRQAEKASLESALEERSRLLESLLAAPRRIAKMLGVVREPADEDGDPGQVWAVVEGPPHQAVQFGQDVDPDEFADPDEPLWVWLVESAGTLVVAGRIDPPPLLQPGMEREMVFDGFCDEGATDYANH